MKNSIKGFLKKLLDNNNGELEKGFAVLKDLRGGKIPPADNSGTECTNSGTKCTGTNKHDCDNQHDCTGTSNPARCSNNTCVF